ncbi:MAG: 2-C-methyl-D-erythritol 4-phosphate cytidylyltransferase [Ornithinimicrobium sp.]
MGAGRPKALVEIDGRPLIAYALRHVLAADTASEIVVVAPAGHAVVMHRAVADVVVDARVTVTVIDGGDTRADSVERGTAGLSDAVGVVLVHDAARAFTPAEVFTRVVSAVRAGHAAVIPVVPVPDTIKMLQDEADYPRAPSTEVPGEYVAHTVDRTRLRAVQTPQGFLRETLQRAQSHAAASGDRALRTDDAGLVEAMGGRVLAVAGDARAHKITTAADIALARTWVREET